MTVATRAKLAHLRTEHPDCAIWQVGIWWWAKQGTRWTRALDLDSLDLHGLAIEDDTTEPGVRATGRGQTQEGNPAHA